MAEVVPAGLRKSPHETRPPVIAVLIPCYNEEHTIHQVVTDFRRTLPGATIYVYDNNSLDRTKPIAAACGAVVGSESMQGKGHVVRRMFADIDADAYILVDGDDTYDAESAPVMLDLLLRENLDMVVACRADADFAAYRRGHRRANLVLTRAVAFLFGNRFKDVLSGYRVLSRRFVKSFPVFARGFEIETEITVHALTLQLPGSEIESRYRARPKGSVSKLRTYQDGFKIIKIIFHLVRGERPLFFFSWIAGLLAVSSLALGYRVIAEFLRIGLVPHFPTAILAAALGILSALSLTCGFVLDTVTRGRRSMAMLAYLATPLRKTDSKFQFE